MKNDQPSGKGYEAAAWFLSCDVPAIMAVAAVESGREGAFYDDGQPVILYEPHVFSGLTHGKHDGKRAKGLPDEYNQLSYPKWKPGAYGPSAAQHLRLQAAALLDRDAALQACSWGLFQIMGANYRRAGHTTIQRFVTAAYRSADDHLRMFVHFILGDGRLVDSLRAHNWEEFARLYNGPSFKVNNYDSKMADAFKRLGGTP